MTTVVTPHIPLGSPPQPEVSRFVASDGYELGYRLWVPRNPRAIVVALHGIQSHSGWYGWSSSQLAEAGYVVAWVDRRGSGVNAVARGDAPHAERLVNDVVQFVAHLDGLGFGRLPRILAAISWGGKLAAATTIRRPDLFAGLALITPGLCTKIRANPIQRAALRIANAVGAGRRMVPIPLQDPGLFTDDPASRDFIQTDPLTLHRVTVRFLNAGLALDRLVREGASTIERPVLLLLAGRDRIVDNDATIGLVESFGTRDRTVREYPSARHTLEFETNREEFIDDIRDWIEARFPARAADDRREAPNGNSRSADQ